MDRTAHQNGRSAVDGGGHLQHLCQCWCAYRDARLFTLYGYQARIAEGSTAVSTSTRNFPNRLGKGANVYLSSAELASVAAILGKLPTVAQYMEYAGRLDTLSPEIYKYLNFDKMDDYVALANRGREIAIKLIA